MTDPFHLARQARLLLWVQGVFYILTGLWPIMHMPSFLAVTGPKHDLWLVQTVGGLLAVIGLTWCVAGASRFPSAASVLLAVLAPLALIAVDVVFTTERIIAPIYLLDAGVEGLFLIGWLVLGIILARGAGSSESRYARHLAVNWR